MKLYAYKYEDGKIEQEEVEVEEKVVLVHKERKKLPFIYEEQIYREEIGEAIGYYPSIFLEASDFEYAKGKFLENKRKELKEKEGAGERIQKSVELLKEEIKALEQTSEETK